MPYPLLIVLSLSPSVVWLLFFLQKDAHPEHKSMVLKIFSWGALIALPAVFIEIGLFYFLKRIHFSSPALFSFFKIFIAVALVEELLKYLVVRVKILKDPEFDEPVDLMLYMIISALGFVFLENFFVFLSPDVFSAKWETAFVLAGFRFISATFLHALCSGVIGFFLALSCFEKKRKNLLFFLGFSLAVSLHGLYNLSIIKIENSFKYIIPFFIIVFLAVFVSWAFKKIKTIKSVCEI